MRIIATFEEADKKGDIDTWMEVQRASEVNEQASKRANEKKMEIKMKRGKMENSSKKSKQFVQ